MNACLVFFFFSEILLDFFFLFIVNCDLCKFCISIVTLTYHFTKSTNPYTAEALFSKQNRLNHILCGIKLWHSFRKLKKQKKTRNICACNEKQLIFFWQNNQNTNVGNAASCRKILCDICFWKKSSLIECVSFMFTVFSIVFRINNMHEKFVSVSR